MSYADYMMSDIKKVGTHGAGKTNVHGFVQDKNYVTNAEFAEKDSVFRDACAKVGVEPTARQAGQYRRKTGSVYKATH